MTGSNLKGDRTRGSSALAAVEVRLELQSRDLAEAARSRWGIVTAGGDRTGDAPDRELAVDLCPAVAGEANRRRAERDLGVVLDVEERRPGWAR